MVEIAAGLQRAARRTEGSLGALVLSTGSVEVTAAAVRQAVRAAAVSDDEIDRATPLEIQETSKGPAVVLTDADPDDMLPVLERLAQRLSEAGLTDATLTVLPRTNPWGRDAEHAVAAIKCWMVLRGQRPDGWSGPRGWGLERPYWQTSDDEVAAALVELVDWAVSLPGQGTVAAVSSTVGTYVPVPLEDAYAFMRRTQERLTFTMVNKLIVTAGKDFRSVDLRSREGLVAASEGVCGGKALDWRTSVHNAHTLLSTAGAWCAYGHLTRGTGTMSVSTLAPDGDREVGNPWISRSEDWAELVTGGGFFDAYAIMRLPTSVRAQVEAEWQITALPVGSILATHPDQAAWFSQSRVNASALDTARRSLGTSLIDRSQERVNG